ncbi:hypothetical protein NFJ02_24g54580 [Pycnococcus provasolii]
MPVYSTPPSSPSPTTAMTTAIQLLSSVCLETTPTRPARHPQVATQKLSLRNRARDVECAKFETDGLL